jgi:hypothetical protein
VILDDQNQYKVAPRMLVSPNASAYASVGGGAAFARGSSVGKVYGTQQLQLHE